MNSATKPKPFAYSVHNGADALYVACPGLRFDIDGRQAIQPEFLDHILAGIDENAKRAVESFRNCKGRVKREGIGILVAENHNTPEGWFFRSDLPHASGGYLPLQTWAEYVDGDHAALFPLLENPEDHSLRTTQSMILLRQREGGRIRAFLPGEMGFVFAGKHVHLPPESEFYRFARDLDLDVIFGVRHKPYTGEISGYYDGVLKQLFDSGRTTERNILSIKEVIEHAFHCGYDINSYVSRFKEFCKTNSI